VTKLVTLEEWAKRRYERPPHVQTLRRWVREAKIVPAPTKEGRSYAVSEHAIVVDWNDPRAAQLAAAALSESAQTHRG
jgi:hypothetical protein